MIFDKRYKVKSVAKFLNLLIKKGRLNKANSIVSNTLFLIKKKTKKNPLITFYNAIKILTPGVTTRKTVVAGKLYHLPSAITKSKSLYFGCFWLQKAACENKDIKHKSLSSKIFQEIMKTQSKKGQAFVMLKQHNKTVSSNKPFLRFARKKFKPRLPRHIWLRKKMLLRLANMPKKKPLRMNRTFQYNVNYSLFDYKVSRKLIKIPKKLIRRKDKHDQDTDFGRFLTKIGKRGAAIGEYYAQRSKRKKNEVLEIFKNPNILLEKIKNKNKDFQLTEQFKLLSSKMVNSKTNSKVNSKTNSKVNSKTNSKVNSKTNSKVNSKTNSNKFLNKKK